MMIIPLLWLTGSVTAVDIAPLTLKLVEKAAIELGYEVNNSNGAKIHTQVICFALLISATHIILK